MKGVIKPNTMPCLAWLLTHFICSQALEEKHVTTAKALLEDGSVEGAAELATFVSRLRADFERLTSILRAIATGAHAGCAFA